MGQQVSMHQGREALDYQAQTKVGHQTQGHNRLITQGGFRSSSGSRACRSTYGQACDTGYQSNAPARNEQSFTDKLATHPSNCNSVRLYATSRSTSQRSVKSIELSANTEHRGIRAHLLFIYHQTHHSYRQMPGLLVALETPKSLHENQTGCCTCHRFVLSNASQMQARPRTML